MFIWKPIYSKRYQSRFYIVISLAGDDLLNVGKMIQYF